MLICTNFVTTGKHRGNHPISFIKACSNFKTSALKDHESSKLHTDAVAHFEAIENSYNKLWQSKHRFLLMNINDTNYKIIFEMYIHAFVKKKQQQQSNKRYYLANWIGQSQEHRPWRNLLKLKISHNFHGIYIGGNDESNRSRSGEKCQILQS